MTHICNAKLLKGNTAGQVPDTAGKIESDLASVAPCERDGRTGSLGKRNLLASANARPQSAPIKD